MAKKSLVRLFGLVATLTLTGASLSGCKDDPPPPPMPDQAASGKARAKVDTRGSQMPRISPATMKAYRVETCYYGALGLLMARDAYNKSLGGAEPSASKIPSFGDYPQPAMPGMPPMPSAAKPTGSATAKEAPKPSGSGPAAPGMRLPAAPGLDPAGRMAGRAPLEAAAGRQLPFVRHIRSCSVAKTLKNPSYGELDKAVEEFDKYASELNKSLLDANRYYARKQYEKDQFARGKELHKALKESFPKLDEQLAALGKAYRAWIEKNTKPTEKLDKGGELAHASVNDARAVALALLDEKVDKDAVGKGIEKLKGSHEALKKHGDEDKKSAAPRVVLPKIEAFVSAAEEAGKGEKLSVEQTYAVSAAMAEVVEANQRAVAQMLRMQGQTQPGGAPPMRMMKPRMNDPARVPAEPHEEPEGE